MQNRSNYETRMKAQGLVTVSCQSISAHTRTSKHNNQLYYGSGPPLCIYQGNVVFRDLHSPNGVFNQLYNRRIDNPFAFFGIATSQLDRAGKNTKDMSRLSNVVTVAISGAMTIPVPGRVESNIMKGDMVALHFASDNVQSRYGQVVGSNKPSHQTILPTVYAIDYNSRKTWDKWIYDCMDLINRDYDIDDQKVYLCQNMTNIDSSTQQQICNEFFNMFEKYISTQEKFLSSMTRIPSRDDLLHGTEHKNNMNQPQNKFKRTSVNDVSNARSEGHDTLVEIAKQIKAFTNYILPSLEDTKPEITVNITSKLHGLFFQYLYKLHRHVESMLDRFVIGTALSDVNSSSNLMDILLRK